MATLKAVVDRIEGKTAVLLLGDDEVQLNLDLRHLPEGAQEGSHLRLRFELDAGATAAARERAAARLERLKRLGRR